MAFVTAMFVLFYIKERVSRAKLLQFVSGANKVVFWLTSFVIDYALFILISLLFIGVLAAYQKDGYSTYVELARNFLILFIFGFSVLPYTYVWSFLFQVPSSGLVRLAIGYIISGVFFFMAYFILNNEFLKLQYIAKPIGWIFLIFPHYSLARGMSNLNVKQSTINLCENRCSQFIECSSIGIDKICDIPTDCEGKTSPIEDAICELKASCCDTNFYSFKEDGIGLNLVALGIIGIVSFIMLFAIEYRWIQNLMQKFKKETR